MFYRRMRRDMTTAQEQTWLQNSVFQDEMQKFKFLQQKIDVSTYHTYIMA
jgi:CRISPR/Cas system-associated endoribonuclease Cas2